MGLVNIYIYIRNFSKEEEKLSVFENECLRTIVEVSHMNHIRMDDTKSDIGRQYKITDIIKKKRLKWFDDVVHIDNANSVNYSCKNGFYQSMAQRMTIKVKKLFNEREKKTTTANSRKCGKRHDKMDVLCRKKCVESLQSNADNNNNIKLKKEKNFQPR